MPFWMISEVSPSSHTSTMEDPTAMSLGNHDSLPRLSFLSQTQPSWERTRGYQASSIHWLRHKPVALFLSRVKTLSASTRTQRGYKTMTQPPTLVPSQQSSTDQQTLTAEVEKTVDRHISTQVHKQKEESLLRCRVSSYRELLVNRAVCQGV